MHHWKEKGRKRESYTGVVSSIRSEVVSGDSRGHTNTHRWIDSCTKVSLGDYITSICYVASFQIFLCSYL